VYDGHGGSKIAAHVSKHLHKHILRQPDYKSGQIEDALIKVRNRRGKDRQV
jgi:serine/threonine protein phosphatase PrpC